MNIGILPKIIHPSWDEFLTDEIKNELKEIESKIGNNYNPKKEYVFRFLENDLDNIKVVILGMDPYPQEGAAIGRCFQVGGHTSWDDKFNKSLQNIFKLIHKTYMDIKEYSDIGSLKIIRKDIKDNKFNILAPCDMFDSWEKQGVLLLNATLTVEINNSGSHLDIWSGFSKKLIKFIDKKRPRANWFLWGNDAQNVGKDIINGIKHESRHPSRTSSKYENDFLKSNCFRDTMKINNEADKINWLG
ncbi:uracil-DNA glycosylase [Peptostreptococcaceae bacterium AGR-M142]